MKKPFTELTLGDMLQVAESLGPSTTCGSGWERGRVPRGGCMDNAAETPGVVGGVCWAEVLKPDERVVLTEWAERVEKHGGWGSWGTYTVPGVAGVAHSGTTMYILLGDRPCTQANKGLYWLLRRVDPRVQLAVSPRRGETRAPVQSGHVRAPESQGKCLDQLVKFDVMTALRKADSKLPGRRHGGRIDFIGELLDDATTTRDMCDVVRGQLDALQGPGGPRPSVAPSVRAKVEPPLANEVRYTSPSNVVNRNRGFIAALEAVYATLTKEAAKGEGSSPPPPIAPRPA